MTRPTPRVRGLGVGPRTTRGEAGMVTAETAVVLPVIVAVAVVLGWMVLVAATHLQVVDASREAARLIARGEDERTALASAGDLAPEGTTFTVSRRDDFIQIEAEVTSRLDAPLLRHVLKVDVASNAVTTAEDP